MVTRTSRSPQGAAVTPDDVDRPGTPPVSHSSDYGVHIFAQLTEIQRCMGGMEKEQLHQRALFDKLEERLSAQISKADESLGQKISKTETELRGLLQIYNTAKVVFIIAMFVGGAVLTVIGFVAKEVWDLSKPLIAKQLSTQSSTPPEASSSPFSVPAKPLPKRP